MWQLLKKRKQTPRKSRVLIYNGVEYEGKKNNLKPKFLLKIYYRSYHVGERHTVFQKLQQQVIFLLKHTIRQDMKYLAFRGYTE